MQIGYKIMIVAYATWVTTHNHHKIIHKTTIKPINIYIYIYNNEKIYKKLNKTTTTTQTQTTKNKY